MTPPSPTTSEETNRAVRSYEMDSMTRSDNRTAETHYFGVFTGRLRLTGLSVERVLSESPRDDAVRYYPKNHGNSETDNQRIYDDHSYPKERQYSNDKCQYPDFFMKGVELHKLESPGILLNPWYYDLLFTFFSMASIHADMNYCPECGLEVSDDMAYCSSCGYNLDSEPSATGGQQQSQISESTSSSEVAGEKYERIGKIVAILTVIGSGVLIMDGISSQGVTASRMGSFHEIKWLIVVPPFITGLVSLPMAYGHWFRRMWSWRVTQLIYGIYSISAIISLLYSGPINPTGLTWLGLLITILIFYFLRAYEEGYSEK